MRGSREISGRVVRKTDAMSNISDACFTDSSTDIRTSFFDTSGVDGVSENSGTMDVCKAQAQSRYKLWIEKSR